jgi:glycosyltransferase involved in cell wall biosynthesis
LAVNPVDETIRQVPANSSVSVVYTNKGLMQNILALRGFFNPRVIEEIQIIRRVYGLRLNKSILATLIVSLQRAKTIEKHLLPLIDDENAVLYSYWCDDSALALALIAEKRKKLKTVCRVHGWDVYFEVHPIHYLPFRHYIAKQLDCIYPISQKGKDYIEYKWKAPNGSNIIVSRLGVITQAKIIPSDTFTVVSCSNLIPLKRVELIIKALARIHQPMRWVHFGDGNEKVHLIDLARKLRSNIDWEFKGRVSNAEVLAWYKENNPSLFMNVSSSEGIPVSIMEAMSFGIPVIATDVGGTSEIVNNENGLLLSPNPSEEEICNAITSFVGDSERMNLKSIVAHQTWQKKYNSDVNYSSFVEHLLHPA